jgi:dienelactone hydrolase
VREDEREIGDQLMNTRQQVYVFKDVRGDDVSVLVTLPKRGKGPFPVVLLVHAFSSNGQYLTRQVGGPLVEQGFALIAPDMPRHGLRAGVPKDMFAGDNLEKVLANVTQAVVDIRQTIDLATQFDELDTSKGVGLVGYSMGSWLGVLAGTADRRIKAMVLMAGGAAAIEGRSSKRDGQEGVLHLYPETRPLEAISRFAPRPLLMLNGKRDRLVPEKQVRALFRAARKPKEIKWYDRGHLLPLQAANDAAEWLERRMREVGTLNSEGEK